MTQFRQRMIDHLIDIYGFEHPIVIKFAHMCENRKNSTKDLMKLYARLIRVR